MHPGGTSTRVSSGSGAAKWAAVIVLAAAGGSGLTYSLMREGVAEPAGKPVEFEAAPAKRVVEGRAGAERAPAKVHAPEPEAEAAPAEARPVPGAGPAPVGRRLDLNKATAAELELLPEIGPATAKRIVEYRREHGAFRSVEELDKVAGIGPKTLEKLRPLVTVGGV